MTCSGSECVMAFTAPFAITQGAINNTMTNDNHVFKLAELKHTKTENHRYLKFGDFSIYIGWKTGESKCNVRCFNRHKHTELGFSYELMITKGDRLRVLGALVAKWPDKTSWMVASEAH